MEKVFIKGEPPGGIEECLERYSLEEQETNITTLDLRKSISGYVERKVGDETKYDIYFFFPRRDDSIVISTGYGQIPLDPNKYGFPDDRKLTINGIKIDVVLNEEGNRIYDSILIRRELGLNELLSNIGSMVNNSLEYDIDAALEKVREARKVLPPDTLERHMLLVEKALRESNYTPTGEEVRRGLCSDAGADIRKVLYNIGLPPELRFMHIGCWNFETTAEHDTTLVFDKLTGEWVSLNSKSPSKPFVLVPKEEFPNLGRPYYSKRS